MMYFVTCLLVAFFGFSIITIDKKLDIVLSNPNQDTVFAVEIEHTYLCYVPNGFTECPEAMINEYNKQELK